MHRGVGFVLDIPEDDLVPFGGQHQLLLVGVGGIACDLLEGLSDDRIVSGHGPEVGKLVIGTFFQIFDGVRHFRLRHVHEGVGVIGGIGNVNGDGMAAGIGEIAGLIVLVQLCAGFGVEGLGAASQSTAGGGRCNLRAVRQLILNSIGHQRIGAPLGIEVQIAVDRHGEVKRLFLAGIADVEPADEGVLTI